jgi:hypothetical protein
LICHKTAIAAPPTFNQASDRKMSMSKVLVIFYSYTGTARRWTHLLCAQQQWASAEILDQSPRGGVHGTWRCVLDSLLRRRPEFRDQGPRGGFDAVVRVAPVWAPARATLWSAQAV